MTRLKLTLNSEVLARQEGKHCLWKHKEEIWTETDRNFGEHHFPSSSSGYFELSGSFLGFNCTVSVGIDIKMPISFHH